MSFPTTPNNGQIFTTADGRDFIYDSSVNRWSYRGFDGYIPTSNLAAVTLPTVNDDSPTYEVGSLWILNQNELYICIDNTTGAAIWKKVGATVGATAPSNPTVGEIYLSNVNDIAYIWNGASWVDITGATITSNNYTSTTDPTSADNSTSGYLINSMWLNNTSKQLFICTDPTVAVWLPISGKQFVQLTTDPVAPAVGDVWYNTTTNTFKCSDGVVKTFVVA